MPRKKIAKNPVDSLDKPSKSICNRIQSELLKIGVVTDLDSDLMYMLSCTLNDYSKIQKDLAVNGYTEKVIGDKGREITKTRPEVNIMVSLANLALKMMNYLGLSPASRAQILSKLQTSDNSDDELASILNEKK